jgi:diguanylate cyclase (GGDEF)-like protein
VTQKINQSPPSIAKHGTRGAFVKFAMDWVPQFLAIYAIPLAIALISITALFLWDSLYSADPERAIELRSFVQTTSDVPLSDIRQELAKATPVRYFNTKLSEHPIWFSVNLPPSASAGKMVEFPSRHAVELTCWDGDSQKLLGQSGAASSGPGLVKVRAGFALTLERQGASVICRGLFVGPARLSANLWAAEQLNIANHDFHRKSGLLDGATLALVVFTLITAVINRQSVNLIFAAWLIVTLRINATSAGWDEQWLNHAVPSEWISQGRSFARAAWGLLTVTLFKNLFRNELAGTRLIATMTGVQWLSILLFAAAAVLPRHTFLLMMWFIGVVAIPLMLLGTVRVITKNRSSVALLYAGSLSVAFLSSLFEIVAAVYGVKGIDNSAYSLTVAFSSSLLAALAISEQIRQEHKQRLAAQEKLQHTYDVMPIGLFTLDLDGNFTSANPAMHKMLGRYVLRQGRNSWGQYFNHGAWTALHELLSQQQEGEIEVRSADNVRDNKSRRYLVKATRVRDKIEGSLQDVTERSLAAEEMSFLANNDSLTTALNRRGIEEVFNHTVAQLHENQPLAMAYLDLDRFKLINDLYGHNTGDEILRQVCQRVMGLLSGGMRMGRIGGDEFVILLPDTKMTLATVICRSIVDRIDNTPYRVGDKAFHVRGSIGLIEISRGTQLKDAISTADRACREAKTGQGKGLVAYELDAPAFLEHQAEISLVERLSGSDALAGLFVEMQPIMSLTRPHDSFNFEVLLRMRDQDGTLVPVSRLIAAAEHSGRMGMIDNWVLSSTLAWLDRHRPSLQKTQFVCVNLSGSSLNDEEFMQDVFDLLRRNSHVVSFLSIEITESVALHDLSNTRRFIDKVRGYGARVALDDFGAGYTSFSYIKELPADLLKIDGSFIVNMNRHPANVSIVEAIVSLARNLGMKTVAEWAEDAETVETLAEIGVDYVQGFVVARPQLPERLLEAASAASFIQDEKLLQLIQLLSQPSDPMAKVDLILDDIDLPPRKVH